jgi:hypothetical protein
MALIPFDDPGFKDSPADLDRVRTLFIGVLTGYLTQQATGILQHLLGEKEELTQISCRRPPCIGITTWSVDGANSLLRESKFRLAIFRDDDTVLGVETVKGNGACGPDHKWIEVKWDPTIVMNDQDPIKGAVKFDEFIWPWNPKMVCSAKTYSRPPG